MAEKQTELAIVEQLRALGVPCRNQVACTLGIIDVLVATDPPCLIEAKAPLSVTGSAAKAIGQLLCYRHDFPDARLFVADEGTFPLPPGMAHVLADNGIEVWTPETADGIAAEWSASRAELAANRASGLYRTLVIDPPWLYLNHSGRQSPDYAPRMMTMAEIAALDLGRWADPAGCHVYLWATDLYAGSTGPLLQSWGAAVKCVLVWEKTRLGMGNYYRHQHELCMFAVRGRLPIRRRDLSTLFRAPTTGHSAKPDAFYSLVETASPGPYLDVFARRHRAGWDVWGDEIVPAYQLRLNGSNASQRLPL